MPRPAKSKTKWLETRFAFIPHFALCLDEADYVEVMNGLKSKLRYPYGPDGEAANAWVKSFTGPGGSEINLVCLSEKVWDMSLPAVCALLAHEAVHIYQHGCQYIGEDRPGKEFQAYMIQHITEMLIADLFKRKFPALATCVPSARKATQRRCRGR